MTSKMHIKAGSVEIKFVGSEEYIKDQLPNLIKLLHSLSPSVKSVGKEKSAALSASTDAAKKGIQMTTETIAMKLGGSRPRDLILASCAYVAFNKNVNILSRNDIHAAAKSVSYYKESIGKNLTSLLRGLVKDGYLVERSKDKYAFQAKEKEKIKAVLYED